MSICPYTQCGDNTTECPPPPEYHKDDKFVDINGELAKKFKWLADIRDFMVGNFGKFVLAAWFFHILLCLGVLKVLHMLLTGQVNYPALTNPAKKGLKLVYEMQKKIFDQWCPMVYSRVCGGCERCCLCCCAFFGQALTGQKDHTATARQAADFESGGWRRPRTCNGMCSGAKQARRNHRKQMRINKRKGMKNETAWYQKPYNCTCKVK